MKCVRGATGECVALVRCLSVGVVVSLVLATAVAGGSDSSGDAAAPTAETVMCVHDMMSQRQLTSSGGRRVITAVVPSVFGAVPAAAPRGVVGGAEDASQRESTSSSSSGSALSSSSVGSSKGSGVWEPLRVKVSTLDVSTPGQYCSAAGQTRPTYDGKSTVCTAADVLTAEKRALLLNTVLPAAIKLHTDRLMVNRVDGALKVERLTGDVCGEFTVPSQHLSSGVSDADVVVYVAAAPIPSGAGAWAVSCGYMGDGRPSVGVINIGPVVLDSSTEGAVRSVAHELLHVLGFSSNVFLSTKLVTEVPTLRGKSNVPVIATPTVLAAARKHYGCDTMVGAELEDQGAAGSSGSHWKRRSSKDDLMAPIMGVGRYTRMTLAVMEDLGFYKANYDKAETMVWGSDAGCSLFEEKCVVDGESQHASLFCTVRDTSACTSERLAVGYCSLGVLDTPVAEAYRYFADPRVGGTTDFMDYCPSIDEYGNTGCTDGDEVAMPGSFVSSTSRCFTADKLAVAAGGGYRNAVCAAVRCREETRTYDVRVHGAKRYVECPAGSSIRPSLYSKTFRHGMLNCPAYSEVCEMNANASYNLVGDGEDAAVGHVPALWSLLAAAVAVLAAAVG